MLHLIIGVGSRDWVRDGEDSSVISLLGIGLVSVPLMGLLVLLLIASSVIPSHSMVLDEFVSN